MSNERTESDTHTGPVPDGVARLLAARDTRPLPAGALVRVQVISRGLTGGYNYRWLLYADGRLFLARNDPEKWVPGILFNTEYPADPAGRVGPKAVAKLQQQFQKAAFFEQPSYQANPRVEDGSYMVVTARMGDREHEIIYNAVSSPLVEYLTYFPGRHASQPQ